MKGKVRCLLLVCALSGATAAAAQTETVAPAVDAAQPAQSTAPPASDAALAPPAPPVEPAPLAPPLEPAPTPPSATVAPHDATPNVSVFPPPPPPGARVEYQPAPGRIVMLVPQKHAIRPRSRPVYGDAGAPFAVGAGLSISWPSDSGYALAGHGDKLAHGELFATYDVWQPVKGVVFSLGAHYRALLGGDDRAEINERAIQADLTARFTATPWLFPHLRAAGGAIGTSFRIADRASSGSGQRVTYEDKDWAQVGTIGAGFTLRTRARAFESHDGRASSLSLGVLVEGGYIVAPVATLRLEPESSPTSGVRTKTTQAGSLDRSAPYMRVAGVIRF